MQVEEELRVLPENPFLPEAELYRHFNVEEAARCIDPAAASSSAAGPKTPADETLEKFKAKFGITPLEALVRCWCCCYCDCCYRMRSRFSEGSF